ncbi:MAG TPA: hypothetical protein VF054_12430 [Micromonosporaceae bacterium]
MLAGLVAAVAAAICYGIASVLQALGANAAATTERVDPRLLVRVVRQGPFVAGLALDLCGFIAQLWALRVLPLFVVQAAIAGSLAVTAVVAVPLLSARLTAREWLAIIGVCAGLALLALSSASESPRVPGPAFGFALLGATALLALLGVAVGGWRGRSDAAALGAVAGLGFAIVALAARSLPDLSPAHLIRSPSLYALAAGGVVGFTTYAAGLQRGAVTTVTAALVVGETGVPAIVGVLLLGDRPRTGYVWAAVLGFALAVAAALELARFGEPAT